jgi:hypothetical protein
LKRHRLPFRDDMVRAIRREVDPKTVTRRTSERFADWRPGDLVDVCEGLRRRVFPAGAGVAPGGADRVAYTADEQDLPGSWVPVPWRWKVSRLAPRYCPADLIRTRLEVVSVTTEPAYEGHVAGPLEPRGNLPMVDEAEARREGFATLADFHEAFVAINGGYPPDDAVIYRIEFRRLP